MKTVDFPEANVAIAKDQPEYLTLYAAMINSPQREMIVEFELTEEEIADIVKNKKLYYVQLTFANPFQPMSIHTKSPIRNPVLEYDQPADENRVTSELWDATHYLDDTGIDIVPGGISMTKVCKNCGKHWDKHFFSTRQCEMNRSFETNGI